MFLLLEFYCVNESGKELNGMAKKKKSSGPEWSKWAAYHEEHGGGFFGRALFIIGLLVALNMMGVLEGVNIWIQILIGAGFSLMRLD